MNSVNKKIGESTIVQDTDSAFSDFTIIEQDDMVIASRKRITTQYSRDADNSHKNLWVTKELCYNAAGNVVMVRTVSANSSLPSWSPEFQEVMDYINPK